MEGTVKKWMMSYGFIDTSESQEDVFVHESDVQSGAQLNEGTKVKFDMKEDPRGPKAIHVEVIE